MGPATAMAATRYADPGGSASADCAQATPCDLVTAINQAVNNDTVIVNSGTYGSVAAPLPLLNPNVTTLTVQGARGGAGRPRIFTGGTIGLIVSGSASDLYIENQGIAVSANDNATVSRVVAVSRGNDACNMRANSTIDNSLCWAQNRTSNSGLIVRVAGVTLRNVTAVGYYGLYNQAGAGSTTVTNSILMGIEGGSGRDVLNATGSLRLNTDLYTSAQGSAIVATGQVNADPVFVDATTGDFHQAPTSPSIDAGIDDPLNGLTDIDGDARTIGARTDIGADEFVAATDTDGDGVNDGADNCPQVANPDQADLDADQVGDACDPDIDGDGFDNGQDAFPRDPAEHADTDGDGVGDNADAFPNDPTESRDTDSDGVGDHADNCPNAANPGQADVDGDGIGDACDPTLDNNDASVTLTPATQGAHPGDTVHLSLTAAQPTGTGKALVATVAQPAGLTFQNGDCQVSGSTLTCSTSADSKTFDVAATVNANASPGDIQVQASVATTGLPDRNPADNTASATVTVSAPATTAKLNVSHAGGPSDAAAGNLVAYVIGVTNSGPGTAHNVVLRDKLPAAIVPYGAIPGCNTAGQDITCQLGDMPKNGFRIVAVVARVKLTAPTTAQTATATASSPDAADASASATITPTAVGRTPAAKKLVPTFKCVQQLPGSAYIAVFGYTNSDTARVTAPLGSANTFAHTTDALQPQTFDKGSERETIAVPMASGTAKWTLAGTTVSATRSSTRC